MRAKLATAVEELHASLAELAGEYRTVAERHAGDHDVVHLCGRLATECEAQAGGLRELAGRQGHALPDAGHEPAAHSLVATLRRTTASILGRSPASGEALLADLRHLYVLASDCEVRWTIVGQGAKASRDAELAELFSSSCEEIVGQLRWIKTKLKLAAPQVLATG